MTQFYHYWLAGQSKAQSLGQAMRDTKEQKHYSAPYYSAFTLIGEAS